MRAAAVLATAPLHTCVSQTFAVVVVESCIAGRVAAVARIAVSIVIRSTALLTATAVLLIITGAAVRATAAVYAGADSGGIASAAGVIIVAEELFGNVRRFEGVAVDLHDVNALTVRAFVRLVGAGSGAASVTIVAVVGGPGLAGGLTIYVVLGCGRIVTLFLGVITATA